MVQLREGLSVLVTNFDQSPAIQRTVYDLVGSAPNLVYITLAEHPRFRENIPEEFASAYRHLGQVKYIGSGEDSPHHQRLIHHATMLVFGNGSASLLQHEMEVSGLARRVRDRINDPRPLTILTLSAGSVYMGQEEIKSWMVRRDTGRLTVLGYRPMMGLLDGTYIFVHGEDASRRTLDRIEAMLGPDRVVCNGYHRPSANAVVLYDDAALLFRANRVEKVGGSRVQIARKVNGYKKLWDW